MYKKVLLTGASGFLGTYLYKALKAQYQVDTLGRNTTNTVICDVSENIPQLKTNYHIAVHSAGKAHTIPKTEKEKEAFIKINYQGTKNLCKALENNVPETFIFISTIAVYGKETGTEITENTALNGKTPYAKSKIKAELFLQEWTKRNKVNLIILRLPLVAGKNPKGNLKSMITSINKGYYFNIAKTTALKSIVLAKDVATLLPQLENKNGIYNLSGEKNYSFKEIANIIAKQLNHKKVRELPYFFIRFVAYFGDIFPFIPINNAKFKKMTSNLTVSSKKAVKEIQWKPSNLEKNFKIK